MSIHIVESAPVALSLRNVVAAYVRPGGSAPETVVHGVSLEIQRGQTLALVGQSGSGKSTLALAAAGLLPANGRVLSGSVHVGAQDVTRYSRRQWLPLRGRVVGFVPQDPLSSLDPLQRVGDQLAQALRLHRVADRRTARQQAVALLDRVGIVQPAQRYDAYPHELSGGQLQRVLIAMAISANPSLLIADEPTSALDVTVQQTVLDLIDELQRERELAVLFITHDLALAQDRADQLVVLHGGRAVEQGPVRQILHAPRDAYTAKLVSDAPALTPARYATLRRPSLALVPEPAAITVRGLVKRYPGHPGAAPALADVDLQVASGSVHALVGESGSGKTTLARIVSGLLGYSQGAINVLGRTLPHEPPPSNRHATALQYVYQNALAALDPRYTVEQAIAEPLRIHSTLSRVQRAQRVRELLDQLALPASVLPRRPREISGGQRQRVALGRALALQPRILVLDEPTSALDVSVQAQLIELLLRLQSQLHLTYLFISHDLSLVRQIADEVSVLAGGRLVESGRTQQIFHAPVQPYTQRLIGAMPGRGTLRTAA